MLKTKTSEHYTAEPQDYMKAIKEKSDFYIQFHRFNKEVESVIVRIIHRYLEEYDILYLKNPIIAVVKELLNNSVKSNLKRLFFKQNNLDINKISDYRDGMERFKTEVFDTDNEDIFNMLIEANLVVRISFNTTEDHIHINVINNNPILDSELKKVNSRISKAYKYNDISEAFDDVLDDSEGAGLGLIMAMMLFKNSGLKSNLFKIYKKNNMTISALSIPQGLTETASKKKIAKEILKELEDIPAFPDSIRNIQKLCASPDTTIKEISNQISRDPGLTTSILKLANSAGYITLHKIDDVEEAIKIIGIKRINTLLVASGVTSIIDSKYKKYEMIWKNSYKRAFYAQTISTQLKKLKLSDFAYLAGILSDIGQIVLLSIDSEKISKLKEISGYKGIEDSDLIEEISLGLSHSSLGALIAEKWQFNNTLIKAIEFHHRPYMAPKNLKQLIYTVYLADIYVEIEMNKFRHDIVDEDVLEYFNLTNKKDFDMLHNILIDSYSEQQAQL